MTWDSWEDYVLRLVGGHKPRSSGSGWEKGDIINSKFYIECKYRSSPNKTLPRDWFDTCQTHCDDLIPIVAFYSANTETEHYFMREGDQQEEQTPVIKSEFICPITWVEISEDYLSNNYVEERKKTWKR